MPFFMRAMCTPCSADPQVRMSKQIFRYAFERSKLEVWGQPDSPTTVGSGFSQNVNIFGSKHYSVVCCGSECHSLNGVRLMIIAQQPLT